MKKKVKKGLRESEDVIYCKKIYGHNLSKNN